MFANCFYIKIASRKETDKPTSGAPIDPLMIPRAFREKLSYEGFIHCEWETEANNPYKLLRMPGFSGCPPPFPILAETLNAAASQFVLHESEWFAAAVAELKQTSAYQSYDKKLLAAQSLEEKLVEWGDRETKLRGDRNSLRFHVRTDSVGAKIYRFEKAMDPDRGIITFISTMLSEEREIFGIYSLVRSRSDDALLKQPLTDLAHLEIKTIAAFAKDKHSVPLWFETALLDCVRQAVAEDLPLDSKFDITEILIANQDKISGRVISTICYFTDGIFLNHNGLKIIWDRFALLGFKREDFLARLPLKYGFDVPAKPLPIRLLTDACSEDEVTYAIVHRVLKPNNFRVVSVSYPGAQGGEAVLPEPERGKSQKRNYLDVVALPPICNEAGFDVLLGETKDEFSGGVIEDVAKLKKYQENEQYKTALQTALLKAKVELPSGELGEIVIGVGFGVKNTETTWNPADVDFIFRIKNRTIWQIGIFRQDLKELIPTVEGKTDFPICYEIVAIEKEENQKRDQVEP